MVEETVDKLWSLINTKTNSLKDNVETLHTMPNLILTLMNPGFLVHLDPGGVECARRSSWAISSLFFITNQPNKVSNESWHLYIPVESLNTILSCIVLLWGGTEVDFFYRGNFQRNFWKFVIFRPTWTICISNESWKHSTFKFDIKNRICFEKICENKILKNFRPIFDSIFFCETPIFRKFFLTTPYFYDGHLF